MRDLTQVESGYRDACALLAELFHLETMLEHADLPVRGLDSLDSDTEDIDAALEAYQAALRALLAQRHVEDASRMIDRAERSVEQAEILLGAS